MNLETVPTADLVEDPRNARAHDRRNLDAIKSSLKRFGQVEALVVRRGTNVVVGGHGRLTAMRELGWETAAVHFVDITDKQALALGIALNRTAELASWDEDRLESILADLADGTWLDGLVEDGDAADPFLDVGFSAEEIETIAVSAHERRARMEPPPAPDAFQEYDEDIPTEHRCPKCGYEWSGKSS